MSLKILLITSDTEDYLQDSIIHGFKTLFKNSAVDFPQKVSLYKGFDTDLVRGNGFTLYGLLINDNTSIYHGALRKIKEKFYDVIVFTSIHRQSGLYFQLYPFLDSTKVVFLDGEDHPYLYPYIGQHMRKLSTFFLPRTFSKSLYFKREWTKETYKGFHYKNVSLKLSKRLLGKNLRPIAFSIPEEKIVQFKPVKEKMFPAHIVDKEIREKLKVESENYVFKVEADYYGDLQKSKFGITTKRSGWDCLRHYEIAANGAVMCFRDLNKKPLTAAPHGLLDNINCLNYNSAEELFKKIEEMDEDTYLSLQNASMKWIDENTTVYRAKQLLQQLHINV